MKLLASLRSVMTRLFRSSQLNANWKKNFDRTSSTAPTTWSVPVSRGLRLNGVHVSNLAGMCGTKKSAVTRQAERQSSRQ